MTIRLPEDEYFEGYHYVGAYTDSNETVTTAGLSTYFSLPQKGFAHGIAIMYVASNLYHSYMLKFTEATAKAFGIGGYASSTGNTWQARPYGAASLTDGAFGGLIFLTDLYIDDANERIVMTWDIASSSATLDAKANFWVAKGELVA